MTKMSREEIAAEALARAEQGSSMANYPAIFEGFMAKGIAPADIAPRENVFTFNAWKAKGRSVKKGEHGVKVVTFIDCTDKQRDPSTGDVTETGYRRAHTTTVFHISQTESNADREARLGARPARGAWRRSSSPASYGDPGELAADRWNETHR